MSTEKKSYKVRLLSVGTTCRRESFSNHANGIGSILRILRPRKQLLGLSRARKHLHGLSRGPRKKLLGLRLRKHLLGPRKNLLGLRHGLGFRLGSGLHEHTKRLETATR